MSGTWNPLQLACKRHRWVVLSLLNIVTKQLMHPERYARALFVDFSSAFDSMKMHIHLKRLSINSLLVLWIRDFLLWRLQRVCASGRMSDRKTGNTVCPRACDFFLLVWLYPYSSASPNNSAHKSARGLIYSDLSSSCSSSSIIQQEVLPQSWGRFPHEWESLPVINWDVEQGESCGSFS